jgi:hypothetical protein
MTIFLLLLFAYKSKTTTWKKSKKYKYLYRFVLKLYGFFCCAYQNKQKKKSSFFFLFCLGLVSNVKLDFSVCWYFNRIRKVKFTCMLFLNLFLQTSHQVLRNLSTLHWVHCSRFQISNTLVIWFIYLSSRWFHLGWHRKLKKNMSVWNNL